MTCPIVDVHAHICDPIFDPDRDEVLTRAREAGIARIIAVSEDPSEARKNLDLAARYPMLHPAAGLYPTRLDLEQARETESLIRAHRAALAAIGEVGLDYWVVQEEAAREVQREIFARMVDLAGELDLPLNVHSRSAGRHAIEFLLARGARRVHLHAFDGKASSALPAVEAGYFFSIPPSVVRSPQKQKLVRRLPLSCLLAETDSPVLGPAAGERNEPRNAVLVIKAIAEIKGLAEAEVAAALFENTSRLYGT
jgi:TatD DNase family protein